MYVLEAREVIGKLTKKYTDHSFRSHQGSGNQYALSSFVECGKCYANDLNFRNKIEVFARTTKCNKALHLTLITNNGLLRNAYSGIVQSEVTDDDLFER